MRKFSILHVEDDDATSLLIEIALQEISPEVGYFRVADVDNALRHLAAKGAEPDSFLPQLILLDLNLPRRSGFEMLRLIRGSSELAHLCVVVLTASAAASDRKMAMALGASAYVVKPSVFDEYLGVLRGAIKLAEDAESGQ